MLPTQMYRPTNFAAEVAKIQAACTSRYNYAHERWELNDKDGNVFEIDYEEGLISIN